MSTNLSPRARKNNATLDQRIESSDRDLLISQLKADIFEYQQNEKNYNNLNSKFRNLQNEHNQVCEEKLRLGYDFKQNSESSAKQISNLKYDLENLHLNLNEKLSLNKKLYNDNNTLYKTLENKNAEIDNLLSRIDSLETNTSQLTNENSNLEKNILNLQETMGAHKARIESLQMDLDRYKKLAEENEFLIKKQAAEKMDLVSKLDERRFELKTALGKVKIKEENLAFTQKQLEEANKTVIYLQNNVSELEQMHSRGKLDINSLNAALQKERSIKFDCEKSNENLQSYLRDKTAENNQLGVGLDTLRMNNESLNMEKFKLLGEIDIIKNHVYTVTEANDKLTRELDDIVVRDDLLYHQLNRRENIYSVLNRTRNNVEASLNNLDEFFNKTNNSNLSPGFGRRSKNTN